MKLDGLEDGTDVTDVYNQQRYWEMSRFRRMSGDVSNKDQHMPPSSMSAPGVDKHAGLEPVEYPCRLRDAWFCVGAR